MQLSRRLLDGRGSFAKGSKLWKEDLYFGACDSNTYLNKEAQQGLERLKDDKVGAY